MSKRGEIGKDQKKKHVKKSQEAVAVSSECGEGSGTMSMATRSRTER